MEISKALLSQEPTHKHPTWGLVKVFYKTKAQDLSGKIFYTAEIMEGESKEKWAQVAASDLKPLFLRLVK
jgi:hypothetical protein